jgi:hypothetical protein
VRWPDLDAPTAPTDERDVASGRRSRVVDDGHGGVEYVVTGPQLSVQVSAQHLHDGDTRRNRPAAGELVFAVERADQNVATTAAQA